MLGLLAHGTERTKEEERARACWARRAPGSKWVRLVSWRSEATRTAGILQESHGRPGAAQGDHAADDGIAARPAATNSTNQLYSLVNAAWTSGMRTTLSGLSELTLSNFVEQPGPHRAAGRTADTAAAAFAGIELSQPPAAFPQAPEFTDASGPADHGRRPGRGSLSSPTRWTRSTASPASSAGLGRVLHGLKTCRWRSSPAASPAEVPAGSWSPVSPRSHRSTCRISATWT